MATQNSTITVKGKLGNIVGYKGRKGQKLARIRQTEVKNPKTIGQVLQRMILATASKAYGRMKGITDHSFQGIAYGADSQSYFLKKAMEDIRNYVARTYPTFPEDMRQFPQSFIGLSLPNNTYLGGVGLQISEGTIPTIPATFQKKADAEEPQLAGFGKQMSAASVSAVKVGDLIDALGAVAGDQITSCALVETAPEQYKFVYTRLVINAELSAEDREKLWADEIENMRSGAGSTVFDASRSLTGDLWPMPFKLTANMYTSLVYDQGEEIVACAIILSRKEGNVWQRSTQKLYWLSDAGDFSMNFPDIVVPQWQEGTTAINSPSPYYLNNAEQAGE